MTAALRTGIGLLALLALSACATQEQSEPLAEEFNPCREDETLTCIEYSGKAKKCYCGSDDDLREILETYKTPK